MNEYLTSLMRYRPPVGWWDLLDIAIVSILIYESLKLIRGTRAAQMAVGSLLLVGLFYVSRLAPLQTPRRERFSKRQNGAATRNPSRVAMSSCTFPGTWARTVTGASALPGRTTSSGRSIR